MVRPEGTESVGHKREQLLVVSKTLITGEDGAGVHLQIIAQDPSHTDNVLLICLMVQLICNKYIYINKYCMLKYVACTNCT